MSTNETELAAKEIADSLQRVARAATRATLETLLAEAKHLEESVYDHGDYGNGKAAAYGNWVIMLEVKIEEMK